MIYNMLMYADLRRPSQGAQRSPRPLRPFFVCMCVCIHIYIYIYICIHHIVVYIYIYIYTYVYTTYIYLGIYSRIIALPPALSGNFSCQGLLVMTDDTGETREECSDSGFGGVGRHVFANLLLPDSSDVFEVQPYRTSLASETCRGRILPAGTVSAMCRRACPGYLSARSLSLQLHPFSLVNLRW